MPFPPNPPDFMVPASSVPAVLSYLQSAIEDQIAANQDKAPILVCVGPEGQYLPPDRIRIAENGINRKLPFRAFVGGGGQGFLAEDYEVPILCYSWTGDDEPITVMNRAWTLVNYVETAVRTDLTLGGNVLEGVPTGTLGGEPDWSFNADDVATGRLCEITVRIQVTNPS